MIFIDLSIIALKMIRDFIMLDEGHSVNILGVYQDDVLDMSR